MKIGLVGMPNAGKSTTFSALSGKKVAIENYPFCTIDPNNALVSVPDNRVEVLSQMSKSTKQIYSTVEYVDIAGLVSGAAEGAGLGNQFLNHIAGVDLVMHVVRCFERPEIIHVNNRVNPVEDFLTVSNELLLWDIQILEKAKKKHKEVNLEKAISFLKQKKTLKAFLDTIMEDKEKWDASFNSLALVSDKPWFVVANIYNPKTDMIHVNTLKEFCDKNNLPLQIINSEIALLSSSFSIEELQEMDPNIKKEDICLDHIIKACYDHLGLISFLTTGEKETRSWTIKRGIKSPEAAGEIHTDFTKKFICADVVGYDLYLSGKQPSMKGKDYIVQDGDIIDFKINK
jgi:GTP-binding protein YchF